MTENDRTFWNGLNERFPRIGKSFGDFPARADQNNRAAGFGPNQPFLNHRQNVADGHDPGTDKPFGVVFGKGEIAFLMDVPLLEIHAVGQDEQVEAEFEGGFAHFIAKCCSSLGGLFFAGGQEVLRRAIMQTD